MRPTSKPVRSTYRYWRNFPREQIDETLISNVENGYNSLIQKVRKWQSGPFSYRMLSTGSPMV